jgi:hypothetical protein
MAGLATVFVALQRRIASCGASGGDASVGKSRGMQVENLRYDPS